MIDIPSSQSSNANSLYLALENLSKLAHLRLRLHFKKEVLTEEESDLSFPMIYDDNSPFAYFIKNRQPNFEEYIILIMALVPQIQIDFFDTIWEDYLPKSGDFPRIGGVRETNSRAFLPTLETVFFILAGDDLQKRFAVQKLFSSEHWLQKSGIIQLEETTADTPFSCARFGLTADYVELFTVGKLSKPAFNLSFPARQIHTSLEWTDLILPDTVFSQIEEIHNWVKYRHLLATDKSFIRKIKPGYRALFYGASGTGKTLTASLLGKQVNLDVFKIDLSMVVSKYIGETEKNLGRLFDKAADKEWILFFDEADALFGKRTEVKDAHDKYGNQEVSFLLQKIETYPGLVILSSNFKNNIDEAFARRFNSIIHFPKPSATERLKLWKNSLPEKLQLADDVQLHNLADQYDLTGANIINVTQFACLQTLARGEAVISLDIVEAGVEKEFRKEGRL